jgi:hypothetical protein
MTDFRDRGEVTEVTGSPWSEYEFGGDLPAPPTCSWFALCDHPAAGVVHHPILGNVPTCQRCADKLGLVFS